MSELKEITVLGAREHNLKSVDLTIPRDKLIVFTGLSGSGKSSLALDTIYAEGQRRYVESLSAYARQFLNVMEKPDVDNISGLSPAISIEQKTTSRNPRSTVGTITEVYDYLRLLYARVGVPYSPATGLPITSQQISDMVDRIASFEVGTRYLLLAPIIRDRKGTFRNELREFKKKGFLRVKIDGEIQTLDSIPNLEKNYRHDISLVIDRIVAGPGNEERIAQSLRTALDQSNGTAEIEFVGNSSLEPILFSEKFACPVSGFTIREIEPRLFSFNAPSGACPNCDGLGTKRVFAESEIIREPNKEVLDIVDEWFVPKSADFWSKILILLKSFNLPHNSTWHDTPQKFRDVFFYGGKVNYELEESGRLIKESLNFEGIVPFLERIYHSTTSFKRRHQLEAMQKNETCHTCNGYRLNNEALAVKIGGLHLGELVEKSITEVLQWISEIPAELSEQQNTIGTSIFKEIRDRLNFLVDVGLEYLTLSRKAGTLSGGESQRIRLASQIGSGLTGVLYVLDEPSIGLHQRDNQRLLSTLINLRDKGNTVIVVEHDEEAIREADHLVDIGPRAGIHGGEIVAQGSVKEIIDEPKSLTGKYLSGEKTIPIPDNRRKVNSGNHHIHISGAKCHNLKNVDVSFPIGKMICVTGVSGSGKSSLVFETLYKGWKELSGTYDSIRGFEKFKDMIHIDQRPIGKTPRSNPATYTKAFDPIRGLFANLPMSQARGYKVGRFSFNVPGGRCEACTGDGVKRISMHFLPDVYVTCDSCKGLRYNRETLEIKYRDKTIADVLDMTVEEANEFFKNIPAVSRKIKTLNRVGLGYIKLGQQAPLLSGGEAQRVKLATELSKVTKGETIYLLDEPTTGLHFEDINNLLVVLHELVDKGNTVVIIEHNLDVIKTADWIIDMGPEGGEKGGNVIATGSPEKVATNSESYTGQFLAEIFKNNKASKSKPKRSTRKVQKSFVGAVAK